MRRLLARQIADRCHLDRRDRVAGALRHSDSGRRGGARPARHPDHQHSRRARRRRPRHRPGHAGHAVQHRRRHDVAVVAAVPGRRFHRQRQCQRHSQGSRPVRQRAEHLRRRLRVRAEFRIVEPAPDQLHAHADAHGRPEIRRRLWRRSVGRQEDLAGLGGRRAEGQCPARADRVCRRTRRQRGGAAAALLGRDRRLLDSVSRAFTEQRQGGAGSGRPVDPVPAARYAYQGRASPARWTTPRARLR